MWRRRVAAAVSVIIADDGAERGSRDWSNYDGGVSRARVTPTASVGLTDDGAGWCRLGPGVGEDGVRW